MEHHLQAYFKTESDAESALASLQRCPIRDPRIDAIPDTDRNPFLLPALSFSSSSAPQTGVITDRDAISEADSSETFHYLIEFYVNENDREEVLSVLSKTEAHLDKEAYEKIINN
ncbi:hypothetical protein [Jeotgalibacillus terrae]|uniref:Uncharacterized protein n=1 Tax=Jeotgalibacillus terrae TaxID=587735 RepID=A0ABW5ZLB6_9BACL|nr:hypothetical protein [Jeotgalibacillus terrae]MBM7579938.1 CRISPR/Cas system CSM-associated protein Csm5 (group 7 of RAMP superfamily) [Jeotgalibacillus terrae]